MEDCSSMVKEVEGEENLIAAAQHIVRALGSKKNLTSDEKKILMDLSGQLSSLTIIDDNSDEGVSEIEERLNAVQEKIMSWESDQSMIWDLGGDEAAGYLNAANEARNLTERLESLCLNKGDEESVLLRRAHDVLQTAMARLEEEFRHMLVQNSQPFEPEHVSFRSIEDDVVEVGSIFSVGDESVEDSLRRDSVSRTSEEFIIDLVQPDVIPDLRCIVNLMFNSNYDQECMQAYTAVRKDALDECLFILEIEKLSVEDVMRMEWVSLNSKIKRWVRAMKFFVRVYLASEKCLSDQIFEELGPVNLNCFFEASKAPMLQLLNFGEAISIGPHQPEKLCRILDMYEVLADLIPDIDLLYPGNVGSSIRIECHEVLGRLGDCVRATFLEFENAIATNISASPFAGGGIHHLTRYVMNYLRLLTDYGESLNLLLKDSDREDPNAVSPDMSPVTDENIKGSSSCSSSPVALHFRAVASILESNLYDKSKLYRDASLQHFFLMNNIHYMTQKVKSAELRHIFGDEWIRRHNWKFQQHAMNYERATWSLVLSLLKDDGLHHAGSNSKKNFLKERLRCFNLAFEEVYKTQTPWIISDLELRDDLRISTSLKVIQAYRTFMGRHNPDISEKSIKYSADDLEYYILDLFEGSQKSLHNPSRR